MSGFDRSKYVTRQIDSLKGDKRAKNVHLPFDLMELEAYSEVLPQMPDGIESISVDISLATNGQESKEIILRFKESLCQCLASFKEKSSNYTLVISESFNDNIVKTQPFFFGFNASNNFKNSVLRARAAMQFLNDVLPVLAENSNVTAIEFTNIPATYYKDIKLFLAIAGALKDSNVHEIKLDFNKIYSENNNNKDNGVKFLLELAGALQGGNINVITLDYHDVLSGYSNTYTERYKFLKDLQLQMPDGIKLQIDNEPILYTLLSQIEQKFSDETSFHIPSTSLQGGKIDEFTVDYNHIIAMATLYEVIPYKDPCGFLKFLRNLQDRMPDGVKLQIENVPIVPTLLSAIQQEVSKGSLLFVHVPLLKEYESKDNFVELIKGLDSKKTAINYFTSALLFSGEIPGYYGITEDDSLEVQQKYYIDRMGVAITRFVIALECDEDNKMAPAIKAKLAMLNFELNEGAGEYEDSKDYGRLLQYIDRVCATVGAKIDQAGTFKQAAFANSERFPKGQIPKFSDYIGPSKPRFIR